MRTLKHDEKIGIALTEEEMTLTIRAMTVTLAVLSLIDKLGLTTGITGSSLKWLDELQKDYREINENYKQNKKDESITTAQEN